MGGGRDVDDGTANDTPVGEKWISQSHIEFRIVSKDVESADKKNNSCSDSCRYIGERIGALHFETGRSYLRNRRSGRQ